MKRFLVSLVLLLGVASFTAMPATAHPGRTDKKGGHYCYTNCKKWGLKDGQYHKHSKPIKVAKITSKKSVKTTKKISKHNVKRS